MSSINKGQASEGSSEPEGSWEVMGVGSGDAGGLALTACRHCT